MAEVITSDDILGKDVVDTDGEIIGVVQQLKIDKPSKKILGIVLDQGFMKPDIYVGIKNIKNFGVDSIFLKQSPNAKIKGLVVFDKMGKKIGYVEDVQQGAKNKVTSIVMKTGTLGESYIIKSADIKTIGFNVLLKKKISDMKLVKVKK